MRPLRGNQSLALAVHESKLPSQRPATVNRVVDFEQSDGIFATSSSENRRLFAQLVGPPGKAGSTSGDRFNDTASSFLLRDVQDFQSPFAGCIDHYFAGQKRPGRNATESKTSGGWWRL